MTAPSPDDTAPGAARAPAPGDAEALLLADALDVGVNDLRLLSRAPLGAGTVAGFAVHPEGADVAAFSAYLDTSGQPVEAETGLVLDDETGRIRVWQHPADPYLPALAAVAYGAAAHGLLARAGLTAVGDPAFVAYRPGRRAVVRVDTDAGTRWIKVVRPQTVDALVDRHTALRDADLPVPGVVAWSPRGVLVLTDADGMPATSAPWHPVALADALDGLRDRLGAVPVGYALRASRAGTDARPASMTDRVGWYRDRLASALLGHADRIVALADLASAAPDARPHVTVHGDLHLGQVFVDAGGAVTGLIDVDTAGVGDPAEDEAAFIGHALASASMTVDPTASARALDLARTLRGRWEHLPRTRELTVAHLLGHALTAAEQGDTTRGARLLTAAEAVRDGDDVASGSLDS